MPCSFGHHFSLYLFSIYIFRISINFALWRLCTNSYSQIFSPAFAIFPIHHSCSYQMFHFLSTNHMAKKLLLVRDNVVRVSFKTFSFLFFTIHVMQSKITYLLPSASISSVLRFSRSHISTLPIVLCSFQGFFLMFAWQCDYL